MQTLNHIMQTLAPMLSNIPLWLSVTLLAASLLGWTWLRSRRRLRRLQQEVERMRNDMRAMTTAAVGVGGRVREIEKLQRQIKQQPLVQQAKETRAVKTAAAPKSTVVNFRPVVEDYAAHPYDYAIQLARHGASINDIMYQSGIGQNEAKLIHMLHTVGKAS